VLVDGAIPGERVSARIDRIRRGVAFARTVAVEAPSPDRVEPDADRACGGCLYAHMAYRRQLEIKSQVVADAFDRIGHVSLPGAVAVAGSPRDGYRMRARLHCRNGHIGFFREGTHDICDARSTRQLLPATSDVIDRLQAALSFVPAATPLEIVIAEDVSGSQRVVHFENLLPDASRLPGLASCSKDVTGMTAASAAGRIFVLSGDPYVSDRVNVPGAQAFEIRRHVLAFFQGNRFLLNDLVSHVVQQIPTGSTMLDLYAGGGLFSISAARLRAAQVTAVEGDPVAADDLAANAAVAGTAVAAVHEAVETYTGSADARADVVLVDPPRAGMTPEAIRGVVKVGARRIVYVSCDVATLARDARRLIDAGYEIGQSAGFDLFPGTPHVETVVVLDRP
jgi:23S rRNA (uracil1939-C5)-methyltransferase